MPDDALRLIEQRLFRSRGASYEGDLCSVLKDSPFVVRASEFGLADIAIDCTKTHQSDQGFLDRYWDVHERRYQDPSELLLFDAKSSLGSAAGEQIYVTTVRQRRHVAFFVGVIAADPRFVDVIPNYDQEAAALKEESNAFTADAAGQRVVGVAPVRHSTLPAFAYGGIDQCLAPYRMPLWMLPNAISSIRHCYLAGTSYQNPWTKVVFADWRPQATILTKFIRPDDDSDQATAHEAVMEIYRNIKHDGRSQMRMDIVELQPSLADFKLVLEEDSVPRQAFVQHKLNTTLRAEDNILRRVYICRGDGIDRRWYFTAFERFDFLWTQFIFSHRASGSFQNEFFFIPEKEIPDEFYTTEEEYIDFEAFPRLEAFRIVLDDDGRWIPSVEDILRAHPQPRRAGDRPIRSSTLQVIRDTAKESTANCRARLVAPSIGAGSTEGRRLHAEVVKRRHCEFFYKVMEVCARMGSGLLFVLAGSHGWGDFGFCRYEWTTAERKCFAKSAASPRAAHDLPPNAEAVLISYFTQHSEATYAGPNVRPRQFRRLDASRVPRLTIWDLGGSDTAATPLRAAVIPSEDIMPSDGQRAVFARNLANRKKGIREEKNPNLSALLSTGLFAGEYGVGKGGPLAYDEPREGAWVDMWLLLNQCMQIEPFEHPQGHVRQTARYRQSLRSINQHLERQHRSWYASQDEDSE